MVCEFCSTRFALPASPVQGRASVSSGDLVLAADLQSATLPGWALTEAISVNVSGGELRARCIPDDAVTFVLETDGSFDDLDAQVVAQWDMKSNPEKTPAWAGIAIRSSEDGYYAATISSDGLYSIYWYTDDDSGPLVDDSAHPAIEVDGPNHLRLVAHGEHLEFYVNGTLLSAVHDEGESPFTNGAMALILVSTEQPAAIRFRNLELREVP